MKNHLTRLYLAESIALFRRLAAFGEAASSLPGFGEDGDEW